MSWAFGCAFAFTNRTYAREYPGGGRTEACFPRGPMIQRALSLPIWRILNTCAKTKFRCVIAITSGCGVSNLLFYLQSVSNVRRKIVGAITGDDTVISTCSQSCQHHWNKLTPPTAA
jgi:hypothetical protein